MEEDLHWNVTMVITKTEMDAHLTVNCNKVMFAQVEAQYLLIPAKK